MTQVLMETPLITLIKVKYDCKSDKGVVKLKLCRNPTSSTSGVYEFRMYFFDNENKEEFLLFVRNFNMTIEASGIWTQSFNNFIR